MWSKIWVGLIGLSIFSSAGHAATAVYDFRTLAADGQGSATASASSLVYTMPGLTLSVTGYSGPPNITQNVTQTAGIGLGLKGGDSDQTIDHKEFVDLTFNSTVAMETILFTDYVSGPGQSGDAANVQLISPTAGVIFSGAIPGNSPYALDVSNLPLADRQGLIFEFSTNMGNDNYAIGGVCVEYSNDVQGPSVPLPAAAWSGLALLGALAISRKMRSAFA